MNSNSNPVEMYNILQIKIEEAKKNNQPIDSYVRQQIELLEEAHNEFLRQATTKGYSMQNWRLGAIEVQQYAAMKRLAEQIGDPTEKYDQLIREVRIRIFGEENYKRFFESQTNNIEIPPHKTYKIDEI